MEVRLKPYATFHACPALPTWIPITMFTDARNKASLPKQ